MRELSLETPHTVKAGARDTWRLFDNPADLAAYVTHSVHGDGRASWQGGSIATARQYARTGYDAAVQRSNELMERFEAQAENIITARSVTVHDVSGAFPDVPAYLAGSPCSMFRRRRERSNHAPVCVIVDTNVSAGISRAVIEQRGAALLAFVRLLSTKRAVELWAGVADHDNSRGREDAGFAFTRIDTAPLDVTRAAFMLCHTAATRALGHSACPGYDTGRWPYCRGALKTEAFTEVARQAFPHLAEFVAVPGLHLSDKLVTAPLQWIMERLTEFGED